MFIYTIPTIPNTKNIIKVNRIFCLKFHLEQLIRILCYIYNCFAKKISFIKHNNNKIKNVWTF